MTDTQPKPIFSRLFATLVLAIALAGTVAPAGAADNFYVVRDISVDETASSAAAARTVAVRKGQERAVNALFRRLVPMPYHSSLPKLDESMITPLVASFQVANERTSAQRYLADLTFEFKRDDVRKLLRNNMLPFSESVADPILILPVYQEGERAYLWEFPNPWRTVWVDIVDYGLRPQEPDSLRDDWAQPMIQPVLVPAGDLTDIKAINVREALNLDPAALSAIQEIYGASAVEVVTARSRTDADGTLLLDVTRIRPDQETPPAVQTYKGSEDSEALMQSVIFDLLARMQEDWKRQNVLDFSVENTLAVTTDISSLADWLAIQEKVQGLSAVSKTEVKDLTVEKAFWYVTFVGNMDRLAAALAQQDLTLADQGGYWTLNPK
ncbi:DUF2066 domain-containing protein [uncultured Sneathiella sp.]|uniref:DUF2066 domain-containing protein n=1 Tax=uncultured Sneathiella sp. TaxID=879315 RepID=UPI0030EDE591|tara:strand:+ start:10428 stop:11573 length:1146 start_codon:yes stop_codon:yes gene_type:complete